MSQSKLSHCSRWLNNEHRPQRIGRPLRNEMNFIKPHREIQVSAAIGLIQRGRRIGEVKQGSDASEIGHKHLEDSRGKKSRISRWAGSTKTLLRKCSTCCIAVVWEATQPPPGTGMSHSAWQSTAESEGVKRGEERERDRCSIKALQELIPPHPHPPPLPLLSPEKPEPASYSSSLDHRHSPGEICNDSYTRAELRQQFRLAPSPPDPQSCTVPPCLLDSAGPLLLSVITALCVRAQLVFALVTWAEQQGQ